MKPGAGKSKGNEFERQICKDLSRWWTKGERDDVFYRSASSGAVATVRKKNQNKETAYNNGDVGLMDPIGKSFLDACVIEIKRGYSSGNKETLDVLSIIDKNKGKPPIILRFWEKICNEAISLEREPILIFRRDRCKACVMMSDSLFSYIMIKGEYISGRVSDVLGRYCLVVIVPLESFFSQTKPKDFNRLPWLGRKNREKKEK